MIPEGQYDKRRLDALVAQLRTELDQVKANRKPLEVQWMRIHKAYAARPNQEVKTFPFPGCANLVIPVVAIDVDKVYAWIMALLFGQENLWVAKASRPDMVDSAPRIQEFLEWAQKNELNAYTEVADWTKELCLLGTGILKVRYQRTVRPVYEYREEQMEVQGMPARVFQRNSRIMLHDHPVIEHVPLWDFYVHPQATTIQDSPWCAQRIELSWLDYEERVKAGIYMDDKKLGWSWARSRGSDVLLNLEELDRFKTTDGKRLELYEFWVRSDIKGNGEPEALLITMHGPTGIAVRVDYNPFFNQEPPFEKACFVRNSKRFYGTGLGEMLVVAQEEITTMHNQRIDSSTVRMMPIFKALKTGAVGIDEALFPGRIVHVDSMDDLAAIALSSGAWESTANDEQLTLSFHRERSGVNDFVAGGDGPDVSYATATTALNQLREGKKRFDQTMREVRQALGGIGTKSLELYQQFNQAGKAYTALGEEDGAILQKVLNFPLEMIRASVTVDIAATSAALNKEVEVRTNTLLMQLLQQHNMQVTQTMAQLMNPQLPPPLAMVLQHQLVSSSTLMRRIFESYGQQDVDDLVMNFNKLMGGASGGTAQAIGGPGIAPPPVGGPSGMGAVPPGPVPPGFGGPPQPAYQ